MNLTELKKNSPAELVAIAEELKIDGLGRLHKKDMIFSILKALAKRGEDIYGDGVLEILPDGFGFLRSAEGSYLAGPDDIYVSLVKFDASIFTLVTLFQEKFVHLKNLNVILLYLK